MAEEKKIIQIPVDLDEFVALVNAASLGLAIVEFIDDHPRVNTCEHWPALEIDAARRAINSIHWTTLMDRLQQLGSVALRDRDQYVALGSKVRKINEGKRDG